MAEGTVTEAAAGVAEDPSPVVVLPVQDDGAAHLDVCPKEREGPGHVQPAQEASIQDTGQDMGPGGEWWQSSSVATSAGTLLLTPSLSGSHLMWWCRRDTCL